MAGISATATGAVWTVGFVTAVRTYFDTVTFSCTSSVIAGGCEVVILTVGLIRVIFTVIVAITTQEVENAFFVCTLELVRFAPLRGCRIKNQTIIERSTVKQCDNTSKIARFYRLWNMADDIVS